MHTIQKKTIHIVPVGSNDPLDSYLIPFKNYPPSKIIFLMGQDNTRPDEIKAAEIKDQICKVLPEWVEQETWNTNIFDFQSVMDTMFNIFKSETKKNEDMGNSFNMLINVASSTRVVTIASYITAAHMSAGVYYTKVKDFRMEKSAAEEVIMIPVMPIKPPTQDQIKVIRKIDEYNEFGSLKELVEVGFKLDYKSTGSYRNKYSKIIKDLEVSGFVEATKLSGIRKKIRLTESGKTMAKICHIFTDKENC